MTFTCIVILTAAVVRLSPPMGFLTEKFGSAIPPVSLAPATAVQWAPKFWRISGPLSILLQFHYLTVLLVICLHHLLHSSYLSYQYEYWLSSIDTLCLPILFFVFPSVSIWCHSAWGRCFFWGDPLHCLGFFISDAHRVVDVANIECRYNCCPCLFAFGDCFGRIAEMDDGLRGRGIRYHYYCLFCCFIWRYTVYYSSGGHFGFSIYIS